jgi:hypothetical protein
MYRIFRNLQRLALTYATFFIKFIFIFFTKKVLFIRPPRKKLAFFRGVFVFVLMFSWIFSGWPQIGDFPPRMQNIFAADYLTNASFTGGTTGWTLSAFVYDSAYYQDSAGSVNLVTPVGKNKAATGFASQTIGTNINSTDTVLLSHYWSKQCVAINCFRNNISVEIAKPSAPTTWVAIWTDISIPTFGGATAWAGPSGLDVSSFFDETGQYNIRLYVDVRSGNDGSGQALAWFDNVILDVTANNSSPALSISQPDGVSDTVTMGNSYNITYTLADADDTVTAAFYYDTNNTGLDGVAITGACATAAEGNEVTCSWDTTGLPSGSYYVYGIVNDGVNPEVSAYSGGQITVTRSTAIEVRAQDYTTGVTSITFPEGAPETTASQPYNDIDGVSSPQIFGGAGIAKPVVTLYNGGGTGLIIWYNITTFTNGIVSDEYYLINDKGAICADASAINNAAVFDTDTDTGTTIAAGAGNEKDLYLKTVLSLVAGKTGNSTLTILGETP